MIFKPGSKLTVIQENVFSQCKDLAEIKFPEGLRSIEFQAFADCKDLKKVQLSEGLEQIGNGAFIGSGI